MRLPLFVAALSLLVLTSSLRAESLDQQIADLKGDVAALNQTLFELEEDILHPANTQVAVYLSVDAGEGFSLDSVELQIDGRQAVSHLYTERERQALARGGVQRLYLGNLPAGEHTLSAVLNGQGDDSHYFRKKSEFRISKGSDQAQYQLVVDADQPGREPTFELQEWQ
ncbi:hypothetical protein C8D92_102326 [Tamilnaduibacter salinus]|uniref:AraC family transcriptional regulator n=1 Tax=Tamilnaduibacter salinus TaxID=1484056 RepID=A0A2U1CZQ9_9GAMM|nr:AraC family transcriptional regulator [Tamilnaduibacter salinus]PVY78286.1 hypothetical protein C8D92_102326 [Tamilnaduibacter salinus]